MYTKDSNEAKYQLLIYRREGTGLKYLNDLKAFIEYSNDMDDIYKDIEEYNPNKKNEKYLLYLMILLLICLKIKNLIQ